MELKRVVVTGLGAISPFGMGVKSLMDGLYGNSSAIVSCKEAWKNTMTDLNCWLGAPLKEALPLKNIPRQLRKTMGPVAAMSYLAAKEAVEGAALAQAALDSERTGVAFSSSMGSAESLTHYFDQYFATRSLKNVTASSFFQVMSHTCAANVAHAFGIKGRVISPDSACSSSAQSIGLGYEAIKYGAQDVMLCGGADELTDIVCGSFDLLNATSCRYNDEPSKTPRPFDVNRDGTVCGEGGGCIILESEESALKRGAKILAEVIGFNTASNGTHLAQPDKESIERCMRAAIGEAGISAADIDYINAHATATSLGDIAEAGALRAIFGDRKVPVSSFKGHMGHTLGASGALELAAVITMANDGKIIPTLNLKNPGEGCEGLDLVMEQRKAEVRTFMKNSFAFGGINVVLILRRYEQ